MLVLPISCFHVLTFLLHRSLNRAIRNKILHMLWGFTKNFWWCFNSFVLPNPFDSPYDVHYWCGCGIIFHTFRFETRLAVITSYFTAAPTKTKRGNNRSIDEKYYYSRMVTHTPAGINKITVTPPGENIKCDLRKQSFDCISQDDITTPNPNAEI